MPKQNQLNKKPNVKIVLSLVTISLISIQIFTAVPVSACHYTVDTFESDYITPKDSFFKGKYPNYIIVINDPKNKIELDLKFKAESNPNLIAQNITNGWIPLGLGLYKYCYIPKLNITGSLIKKNNKCSVNGSGYIEHVCGNFSFNRPWVKRYKNTKILAIYLRFLFWWLNNYKIVFPKSFGLYSRNNPFGYDWTWAVFNNGWSLFYGNPLGWIMEGPAIGILYLTFDNSNIIEFSNIRLNIKIKNIQKM